MASFAYRDSPRRHSSSLELAFPRSILKLFKRLTVGYALPGTPLDIRQKARVLWQSLLSLLSQCSEHVTIPHNLRALCARARVVSHALCLLKPCLQPAGAVIGIEHWTLEPRELDFSVPFLLCDRVCPLCQREIPSHQKYFDHQNSDHLNNVYGLKVLINILDNDSQSVMDLASCVLSLYPCQSPS